MKSHTIIKNIFTITYITVTIFADSQAMFEGKKSLTLTEKLKSITPCQHFTFFDPKQEIEKGNTLDPLLNSNLTVTADEKSILISTGGQIYKTLIKPFFNERIIEKIIHHPTVKLSTMITTQKKEDGTLLIVSAGNSFDSYRHRWTSEIIASNCDQNSNQNVYSSTQKDWPIQAIKLNSKGDLLIVANLTSIALLKIDDLSFKLVDSHGFQTGMSAYHSSYQKHRVIDLAIESMENIFVIAAGRHNLTLLLSLQDNAKTKQPELSVIKRNIWQNGSDNTENIKKIHFPSKHKILYTTNFGKAKIIDMYTLLEPENEPTSSDDFSNPSQESFLTPYYDQVSLDTGNGIACAHWTTNKACSEEERSTIYVCKMNDQQKEYLKLTCKFTNNRHDYISNKGQLEEHNTHFTTVTLYNTILTALTSSGEIFIWKLPEPVAEDVISTMYSSKEKEWSSTSDSFHRRPRSQSNLEKSQSQKTKSDDGSPKKPSPRTKIFTLTPRSGGSTPRSGNSPFSSPRNSPRKEKKYDEK